MTNHNEGSYLRRTRRTFGVAAGVIPARLSAAAPFHLHARQKATTRGCVGCVPGFFQDTASLPRPRAPGD